MKFEDVNNQKKYKPLLLEILGSRELQLDPQAPVDKRETCMSGFKFNHNR